MFGSMVLEVAIGVVFVYLLLSLIITAVTELISGWLKWRSKHLEQGLQRLLRSDHPAEWVQALYEHPLIEGLSRGRTGSARDSGPSYIPSRTFALALLDVLRDKSPETAKDLPAMIESLPDAKLKKSLLALLEDSGRNLEALKENIEVWFNNSMDRVSGWYKRKVQLVHVVLAAVLTLVVNVDTVLIVDALSTNQALRQAIVAEADAYADREKPAAGQGQGAPQTANPAATYQSLRQQLDDLDLPVGWILPGKRQASSLPPEQRNADYRTWPGWWPSGKAAAWLGLWSETIRFHLFGWLLTAFAASLGAPFWFDMLNKIINIRSSGKAPEEKPKAPKQVPRPLEPGETSAQPAHPPAGG